MKSKKKKKSKNNTNKQQKKTPNKITIRKYFFNTYHQGLILDLWHESIDFLPLELQ